MVVQLVPAPRSIAPQRYPLPWNTTSTLPGATNGEYFYDYAGQDPINGYDLDGNCWTCWATSAVSWVGHHVARGAKWVYNHGIHPAYCAIKRHPVAALIIGGGIVLAFSGPAGFIFVESLASAGEEGAAAEESFMTTFGKLAGKLARLKGPPLITGAGVGLTALGIEKARSGGSGC